MYVCRIHLLLLDSFPACWYQGCSFRLVSFRFVSFRFSSLRISLRYARGDLGAQPPTRELVNYFAQRDTSFMLLDPFLSLSFSLLRGSHVRAPSPSSSLALSLVPLLLARARSACIRYLRRGAIRRQFPSSDKVCIAAAERAFARARVLKKLRELRFEFYLPSFFLSFFLPSKIDRCWIVISSRSS